MPNIVMTPGVGKIDGSIRAKAWTFLQKLAADDTAPGLHVEPIEQSVDKRVRTGRVDEYWRAVMFRLDAKGVPHYVIHGVFQHDEAIRVAKRVRLKVNVANGVPEIFEEVDEPQAPAWTPRAPRAAEPAPLPAEPAPADVDQVQPVGEVVPLFERLGHDRDALVDVLGLPVGVVDEVFAAGDEDAVLSIAERYEGTWLALALVDLAAGDAVDLVRDRLRLGESVDPVDEDDDESVLETMRRPGAQGQFVFVGDQDELRRVIEGGDFGAWRIFLHPEQRRFVEARYSGAARVSGGAGTGKTVVLIHRARTLAMRYPGSRIVLTTFTTNLADALRDGVTQLDPTVPVGRDIGQPGVVTRGVDAVAAAIVRGADARIADAVEAVLGERRTDIDRRATQQAWNTVLDAASHGLPPEIANVTFLSAEYATVVLPHRVRTLDDYLRVRRPGRGLALDRAKRTAVWALVERYRAHNRTDGALDYAETAAVAAEHLRAHGPRADHVLVDEGQDLSPTHWQMLRALVAPGPDDLFIADDSHQRIYGPRVVLSRCGISITGRSRRLTLNYRTTAENLGWALGVLAGGEYVDLDGEPDATGYRSARRGPKPRVIECTASGELDAAAASIGTWLDDDAAPESIAVLVRTQYERDRVVAGLHERGVQARAVDREKPAAGQPLVMTRHRAKGTEFSRVILTGVGLRAPQREQLDPSEQADAELRDRSLLYVAATRARDELVVLRRH